MKRRDFLINSALMLGIGALFSGCGGYIETIDVPNQVARRKFKDITLPLLSLGCLRLPKKNNEIDMQEFQKMVDYCMEHGINYFDSSYYYMGQKSEIAMQKALQKYNRKDYYIATKINPKKMTSENEYREKIQEQLKEKLKTDYIDFYGIHAIDSNESYEKMQNYKMYETLSELKNKGTIKYIGFSFHGNTELLHDVVNNYKWDYCYLLTNYYDIRNEGSDRSETKKQHDIVKSKNIPVIAMEPLYGGRLANLPKKAASLLKENYPDMTPVEFAFKWALSQENVLSLMSGMNNLKQVKENTEYFLNFKKFEDTKNIIPQIKTIIDELNLINCTGCTYCTEVCPKNIDIPGIFSAYNNYKNEQTPENLNKFKTKLETEKSRSKSCTKCRKCRFACPQQLEIADLLENVYNEI